MIEYFAENLWQLWALVAFVCLIIELTNGDFFIMCFAIGGAITAIAAACGLDFYWELGIFALTSVLCLFFVRPSALRYLHKGDNRVSNADALIGREGRVVDAIQENGYGNVAIDGDVWKAKTEDGSSVEKDERVKVVKRESTIITVVKL